MHAIGGHDLSGSDRQELPGSSLPSVVNSQATFSLHSSFMVAIVLAKGDGHSVTKGSILHMVARLVSPYHRNHGLKSAVKHFQRWQTEFTAGVGVEPVGARPWTLLGGKWHRSGQREDGTGCGRGGAGAVVASTPRSYLLCQTVLQKAR